MEPNPTQVRRNWLILIAVLAGAMQVIKLSTSYFVLEESIRSQLLQPVLLGLVLLFLWGGRPWARIVAIVHFLLMACIGTAVLGLSSWTMERPILIISILDYAIVLNILFLLITVKALK